MSSASARSQSSVDGSGDQGGNAISGNSSNIWIVIVAFAAVVLVIFFFKRKGGK